MAPLQHWLALYLRSDGNAAAVGPHGASPERLAEAQALLQAPAATAAVSGLSGIRIRQSLLPRPVNPLSFACARA